MHRSVPCILLVCPPAVSFLGCTQWLGCDCDLTCSDWILQPDFSLAERQGQCLCNTHTQPQISTFGPLPPSQPCSYNLSWSQFDTSLTLSYTVGRMWSHGDPHLMIIFHTDSPPAGHSPVFFFIPDDSHAFLLKTRDSPWRRPHRQLPRAPNTGGGTKWAGYVFLLVFFLPTGVLASVQRLEMHTCSSCFDAPPPIDLHEFSCGSIFKASLVGQFSPGSHQI